MRFLYSENAKDEVVNLHKDEFKHLKVRRQKQGSEIHLRNLEDQFLYKYKIEEIKRDGARLVLMQKEMCEILPHDFTLGWCMVDPKTVEKTLPMLNELGIKKIVFVYSEYSQKNYTLDLKRVRRILINSSQQCGRSRLMEIETKDSVGEFLSEYPKSKVVDFGGSSSFNADGIKSVLVGAEGGFSQKERGLFKNVLSFKTPLILTSESACVGICSKILL